MKTNPFLIFFLIAFSLLVGGEAENEIIVKLDTEVQLIPLYLADFSDKDNSFDKAYRDNLQSVLQFDLMYNGTTYLVPFCEQNEALAHSVRLPMPGNGRLRISLMS